mmetsp:Transcript_9101/g.18628  ORF Transcript_9101/g.18628 Transcript_9101/m.18628 type:complete len:266 (+) Transcript_9101:51-848(+)
MAAARAVALKNEGNVFFKAGDYPKAIEKYSAAIEVDPDNHVYYSNRSAAYGLSGQWEAAARDGQKCVSLNSKFLKGYHRAANALKHTKQYKDAIKIIEKGLIHFQGNADFRKLLGELRVLRDTEEKARRAGMSREEALKAEANDLFKAARFEDAIKKYTEALNACSDPAGKLALTIRNNRAACNQQLSNYHDVIDDTTEVLEHEPKNLKALLRRGLAFEGIERFRSALADIRAVLAIDPTVKIANAAQHRIGSAVRELKKQARAI